MTRSQALEELRRLGAKLPPDFSGVGRLLERVAAHDEAEVLRDALVECGARMLLDNWTGGDG